MCDEPSRRLNPQIVSNISFIDDYLFFNCLYSLSTEFGARSVRRRLELWMCTADFDPTSVSCTSTPDYSDAVSTADSTAMLAAGVKNLFFIFLATHTDDTYNTNPTGLPTKYHDSNVDLL